MRTRLLKTKPLGDVQKLHQNKRTDRGTCVMDNLKLSSCGGDRQVFYWGVSAGRAIRKFRGHDSEFHGSVDGSVRTFDIRVCSTFCSLEKFPVTWGNGQPLNCISLSNDGNWILASCLDCTLHILDRISGELLQEYNAHTCQVNLLYFFPMQVTSVSYHPKDNCMKPVSVNSTI
ncbi:hypothetical protein MKW94_017247 [Papaver nudicaule]|uniref:Uncharacterized protein n=1 Tax=Papaver nudicaule TaxID=74823 RepID=A0AA41S4T7_PAPNU|nr:hypothetical protein [Papaver nudicaule]